MSGDALNAGVWDGADVYVDLTSAAAVPTDVTAPWATGWTAVGLLDGSDGFVESRDEQSNDFYAWGSILVASTKSQHTRTITFSALEDNPTTFSLVNPGSAPPVTAAGVTTATVKVPKYVDFSIGFETREGDKCKRRIVHRARVDKVDDVTDAEDALRVYKITVKLFPETDGTLYTDLTGIVGDTGS
jgi:hypothetical protein